MARLHVRPKQKILIITITALCLVLILLELSYHRGYKFKAHLVNVFAFDKHPQQRYQQSQLDEESVFERIDSEQVNLPGYFWYTQVKKLGKTLRFNETCAPIPDLLDVRFANINWQLLALPTANLQLLSAHLDKREANPLGSVVRILGVVQINEGADEQLAFPQTHCQIWSEESEKPVLTQVFAADYLWRDYWGKPAKGKYHPYMLTCVLPDGYEKVPQAVSLVGKACDTATNLLKVSYETYAFDQGRDLGYPRICACVAGVAEVEDKSVALVEWVEWLFLMGVEHVYIAVYNVHEAMQEALDHYSKQGYLTQTKVYLPDTSPNTPYLQSLFRQTERFSSQLDVLAYNECLLRNLYKFEFVIPLELSEIPVTRKAASLQEMLQDVPLDADAIAMQRWPYLKEDALGAIEKGLARKVHLPFLRSLQTLRPKKNGTVSQKCLYNTKTMLMIHHHYPLEALHTKIVSVDVPPNVAIVEKHLAKCPESDVKECKDRATVETRKLDFQEEIVMNVGGTMAVINQNY